MDHEKNKLQYFLSDEEMNGLRFDTKEQFRDLIHRLEIQRDNDLKLFIGKKYQKDLMLPKHTQLRLISPNEVVTLDLRYGRLNVVVDANGVILDATFG